jgi:hypothetical protein
MNDLFSKLWVEASSFGDTRIEFGDMCGALTFSWREAQRDPWGPAGFERADSRISTAVACWCIAAPLGQVCPALMLGTVMV